MIIQQRNLGNKSNVAFLLQFFLQVLHGTTYSHNDNNNIELRIKINICLSSLLIMHLSFFLSPTSQQPAFYRPDVHPVAQSTVSKH